MDNKSRILIVEDDIHISSLINTMLTRHGYAVAVAENGLIGLTLIESFQPDLILLDMFLPLMDGQDFVSVYKGTPHPAPIIGLSAAGNAKHFIEMPGIADFISKPFDLNDLLTRIAAHL
jgi:DNA-binding response OmpR family regulator